MPYAELLFMESNHAPVVPLWGGADEMLFESPLKKEKLCKVEQFIGLLKRALDWESERPRTS